MNFVDDFLLRLSVAEKACLTKICGETSPFGSVDRAKLRAIGFREESKFDDKHIDINYGFLVDPYIEQFDLTPLNPNLTEQTTAVHLRAFDAFRIHASQHPILKGNFFKGYTEVGREPEKIWFYARGFPNISEENIHNHGVCKVVHPGSIVYPVYDSDYKIIEGILRRTE